MCWGDYIWNQPVLGVTSRTVLLLSTRGFHVVAKAVQYLSLGVAGKPSNDTMLCKREQEDTCSAVLTVHADRPIQYLADISNRVEGLRDTLWPLNQFVHDNPELAFEEYKAHEALTSFMRSQEGWSVTASAYGIATAWAAEYDSGKTGPVVSFNAEYGMKDLTASRWMLAENDRCSPQTRACLRPQPDSHSVARCGNSDGSYHEAS